MLLEEFLRDQRKTKIAEQRYFEKLEKDLERIETDEILQQYTLDQQALRAAIKRDRVGRMATENLGNQLLQVEEPKSRTASAAKLGVEAGGAKDGDASSVSGATPMTVEKTGDMSGSRHTRTKTEGSISTFVVDYDTTQIRSCIEKIAKINKKQVDAAFKETQRNRKISSIGSMNVTLG